VEYIIVDNTEANFPLPIRVLFRNTGNVAASPEIVARIAGKSGTIDTITYAGTQVSAGKAETIVVRWNKTGIEPGNYTADVTVRLAGAQIAARTTGFTIVSSGTLSRQGNLTDLRSEGSPVAGNPIKIIGSFENTGMIETKAKLVGEVYRDGTLADTFTSDELIVPVNDRADLAYYLKVQTAGSYTIRAYVLYESKKTDTREVSIQVSGTSAAGTGTAGTGTTAAGTAAAETRTAGAGVSRTYAPLLPGLAVMAFVAAILLCASRTGRTR
jgi:hypothetical protein